MDILKFESPQNAIEALAVHVIAIAKDAIQQKGSFNLAYVNELKGTFPTVVLSHIIPSWTLYEESDFGFDETENTEDIDARDKLSLIESQQNSVKIAYELFTL